MMMMGNNCTPNLARPGWRPGALMGWPLLAWLLLAGSCLPLTMAWAAVPRVPAAAPSPPAGLTADEWREIRQAICKAAPLTMGEDKKLTASDAAAGDEFGYAVAIAGDTVVVGAVEEDAAGSDAGAAYVFERNAGGADQWGEVKKLTPSGATGGESFGFAVAIAGDTVVVTAIWDDAAATDGGAAYVFERNAGGADQWGEVKILTASDAASLDVFGVSVAIADDTVVVGALWEDEVATDGGAAYVFERNAGGADQWGEVRKLTASDGAANDGFGGFVAIGGDTVVVGAPYHDEVATDDGAAYVFERNEGGADMWGEVRELLADDGAAGDEFGAAVGIGGDRIVVGAWREDPDGTDGAGSAYLFERNAGGADQWGQVKKLTASDTDPGDGFSWPVLIGGDTVVVGAGLDDGAGTDAGAVYLFERNAGGADQWGEVRKLTASDAAAGDNFGLGLGIGGATVVVGAPFNDDDGSDSGAAYVYTPSCEGSWTQITEVTASDPAPGDRFGDAVALSGDTAVVGAVWDDGAGTDAGAAYVLRRNAGGADQWGEVKKLTASDGAAGDWFGYAVALSGDTAVVTAIWEDEAALEAGAAYVFERNAGGADMWGEVKKLTASDAGYFDVFGQSVAIVGDTVVVGALYADAVASRSGAAYVFERNAGGADQWGEVKKLTASDGAARDGFGSVVGIAGDTAVVAAPYHDKNKAGDTGAAYVFERNAGGADQWGQVKKLTASDGAAGDEFGAAAAIAGDTVVVGAWLADAGSSDSGSAYLYRRNAGGADQWGEVKKLTASDAAAGDSFGFPVAIETDTVVVGAVLHDHFAVGAGSVYVFERNQGGADQWGQVAELTPSDPAAGDEFGLALAIGGDTMVIGAPFDDDAGLDAGSAYVFQWICPD